MKKSFVLLAVFFLSALAFALPGVQSYLADESGQYVYYKDTSFERESYIGFLFYDEGTYAVRYYAPEIKNKKNPQLPKDIRILFTLDTTTDYVNLTGERIISAVSPEDSDVINYIHDMLYELTARRQKLPYFTDKTAARQEFEQFGGTVTMVFDTLIPIFNLKSITTIDNKLLFTLITAGQLTDSNDTSFFDFTGIPATLNDKRHSFKNKKAPISECTYQSNSGIIQQVNLDAQWKQSMDNLWLLGDNAILAIGLIPVSPEAPENYYVQLLRHMILGSEHSYPDLSKILIKTTAENTEISNVHFKPTTESVTQDFKILTKLQDGSLALFTLTVFSGAYTKNKSYFKNIIDSYTIKN